MIAHPTLENITEDFRERHPDWEIRAIAIIQHQPMTKRGAVILGWTPDRGEFAAFYSTEFSQHGFNLLDFEGPERANETFRDLCRRYLTGFLADTRPSRELETY